MMEMGPSDAGFPLYLILISPDKDFDIKSIKAKRKTIILLIMKFTLENGIDALLRKSTSCVGTWFLRSSRFTILVDV
jgi:hypothetical protein